MRLFSLLLISVAPFLLIGSMQPLFADDDSSPCNSQKEALNGVSSQYKPRLDELTAKGNDLQKDADSKSDLSVDFKVEMEQQKWSFDLPSVTMKDQKIAMGLPEIHMNTRTFSYDLPEIVMVNTKVGQYPETVVHGFNVTVRWHDIIASVPRTKMVRHEFKTDIPETSIRDQSIVIGIPEITMQRQEWILNIPEFTLKKIEVAKTPIYNDYSKRGDEIKTNSDSIKADMKSEIVTKTHELFVCLRNDTSTKLGVGLQAATSGLSQMDASFKELSEKGIDPRPIVVDGANGTKTTLGQEHDDLANKVQELAETLKSATDKIDASEKEAIEKANSN